MSEADDLQQILVEHTRYWLSGMPPRLFRLTEDPAAKLRERCLAAGFTIVDTPPAEGGRLLVTAWTPSGDLITVPHTLPC